MLTCDLYSYVQGKKCQKMKWCVVEKNKLNFSLLDWCYCKTKKFKHCKTIFNYLLNMSQKLHYINTQQRIASRHVVSQLPALLFQKASHLNLSSDTKYHKWHLLFSTVRLGECCDGAHKWPQCLSHLSKFIIHIDVIRQCVPHTFTQFELLHICQSLAIAYSI